jgi:hypothetical protein
MACDQKDRRAGKRTKKAKNDRGIGFEGHNKWNQKKKIKKPE